MACPPTACPPGEASRRLPTFPIAKVRRRAGRKATNPDREPLSTRVVDVTDGCENVMHGITDGKEPKHVGGRYHDSGYTECSHNSVPASPLAAMPVGSLVEMVSKAVGRCRLPPRRAGPERPNG